MTDKEYQETINKLILKKKQYGDDIDGLIFAKSLCSDAMEKEIIGDRIRLFKDRFHDIDRELYTFRLTYGRNLTKTQEKQSLVSQPEMPHI